MAQHKPWGSDPVCKGVRRLSASVPSLHVGQALRREELSLLQTERQVIFPPSASKSYGVEQRKEKIKKRGGGKLVFTASPTATAASIKLSLLLLLLLPCAFSTRNSPPPAHSPPGASIHFWSPTPTFTLPISRSETNGAAIFLPFLNFFLLHLLKF